MNSSPRDFVAAFDLDGTLYSSEAVLGESYRIAIERYNRTAALPLRIPTTPEILRLVGRPVVEIFAGLFPEEPPEILRPLTHDVLRELCSLIRAGGGRLYEGVIPALEEIRRDGFPMILVSNCRRAYLEAVTETFGLAGFFESLHCNEDAPELGKSGLLRRSLANRLAVMTGDRASDGEAARFSGIPWIACAYGHLDEEAEEELRGSDRIVRSAREIPEAVRFFAASGLEGLREAEAS